MRFSHDQLPSTIHPSRPERFGARQQHHSTDCTQPGSPRMRSQSSSLGARITRRTPRRLLLRWSCRRTDDRLGDLCCAQDYVAYRAGREGAAGCLRADRGRWGRRRFRSLSRQRNIFSAGLTSRPSRCAPTMTRSTGLTCTRRPARKSSDARSIALGRRIAKPGRCRTSRAVRVGREPSTAPKLCCAGKPRCLCNGAHIRPRAT